MSGSCQHRTIDFYLFLKQYVIWMNFGLVNFLMNCKCFTSFFQVFDEFSSGQFIIRVHLLTNIRFDGHFGIPIHARRNENVLDNAWHIDINFNSFSLEPIFDLRWSISGRALPAQLPSPHQRIAMQTPLHQRLDHQYLSQHCQCLQRDRTWFISKLQFTVSRN